MALLDQNVGLGGLEIKLGFVQEFGLPFELIAKPNNGPIKKRVEGASIENT